MILSWLHPCPLLTASLRLVLMLGGQKWIPDFWIWYYLYISCCRYIETNYIHFSAELKVTLIRHYPTHSFSCVLWSGHMGCHSGKTVNFQKKTQCVLWFVEFELVIQVKCRLMSNLTHPQKLACLEDRIGIKVQQVWQDLHYCIDKSQTNIWCIYDSER